MTYVVKCIKQDALVIFDFNIQCTKCANRHSARQYIVHKPKATLINQADDKCSLQSFIDKCVCFKISRPVFFLCY